MQLHVVLETTYRTVEHVLSLVPSLLNVALQCVGVERFEQFEAA